MYKEYHSIYAPHLRQFINMKRKLGFKFSGAQVILSQIDRFACQKKETSLGITKEFAEKWAEKRPQESESSRYTRIRYLAQFSSYLVDLGTPSYLPKLPPYPPSTFIPYIYSREEMEAIFKAADGLKISHVNKTSSIICMPALIRLLYCTGIRKGEALALQDKDVNLEERYLRIRDSKNGKERIIPISASLSVVCKEYKKYRDQLPLGKDRSGYFFVKINGQPCGQGISHWFRKCLDVAGIHHTGGKSWPRIHDLRHTFAVTALAYMAEAGLDLYVSLPILSTYLGHQSLRATDHYVRLTANMYPELLKDVNMVCLDVFPKFKNYETN